MGADAVALNRFVPTGRGRINQNDLYLKKQDLLTALELADKAAAEAGIFVYTGIPVEPCTAQWKLFPEITFSTCHCGEVKWAIDPRGNLRTCEQNPETLGNLLENSFSEIVENSKNSIDSFRQWRNSEGCFSCSLPGECSGGCRFAEQFH
jgi:radical SAM protein with 4Fe4S-binding SPASM domain